MTTNIRFLHSLRKLEYLEEALSEGLLFTSHTVNYQPFENTPPDIEVLKNAVSRAANKARSLGAIEFDERICATIFYGMSGSVPMICFTEVHDSRDLLTHYMTFGSYGIVVKRDWLESQGGDRVLYTSGKSKVTKELRNLVVELMISGMFLENGKAIFNISHMRSIMKIFSHIEKRDHLSEVEWRIAGKHGLTGGESALGKRIPLPLSEVEEVIVHKSEDKPRIRKVLKSIASAQGHTIIPPIKCQPKSIRAKGSMY
jgi:hypothetical protein